MKLLEELAVCSDTTGKPIKFGFIGSPVKSDEGYEIFFDDKLIGEIETHNRSYICRFNGKVIDIDTNFVYGQIYVKRFKDNFDYECKSFELKRIDDEQVIDLVRGNLTEWDDIIDHLSLTESKEDIPKVNINRCIFLKNQIKLYDHDKYVGDILEIGIQHYKVIIFSVMTFIIEVLSDKITLSFIRRTEEFYEEKGRKTYLSHEVSIDRLIELGMSNDFSIENIELKLHLK